MAPTPSLLPSSLLLLARLLGAGGAKPPGVFGSPGIGGAPPIGGPPPPLPPPDVPATMGADRSFVTAFFSALPFWISPSKAPCPKINTDCYTRKRMTRLTRPVPPAGREGSPPGGGGGGGGGPPIPIPGGGGGG